MRARIIPLILVAGLLSSCNQSTGNSDTKDQEVTAKTTHLSFKVVELSRKGGTQCPKEMDETATDASEASEDALCALVTLSYPQMSSDVNPELATKLNTIITQQLLDAPASGDTENIPQSLEQFADSFIAEYQEDPNQFTSWELERTVKVAFSTDKLLTLLFEEYGYTGGAHPFSGQRYSVLSLTDGAPVVLADLLNPGYEPPLNVIGEKAFRLARELGEADSLEEQGFSFENNVFNLNDNFGVLKEGLEFVFNSYEIAPYAMGPTQLTIPYEDIHSLIRPDGLLGSTAQ
ncbi:MAG: DUF3298 and DUF4163 domain-containing protein [Thiolinea sp.]